MKTCSMCKEAKEENQFNKRTSEKDGLQRYCISCQKEHAKQWKASYPPTRKEDKSPAGKYFRLYGITEKEYDEMYEEQNGCCKICGVHKDVLDVDHDHNSGRVRALLCGKCNRGIGMFKDNPNLIRRAASYLVDSVFYREAKDILK